MHIQSSEQLQTSQPNPATDTAETSSSRPSPWLYRFALFVSAATLFLITAGASVTSTGSGLAVPDWPLSFGGLNPPMVGGIIYEHGHRMIAGFVMILTIILVTWLLQKEKRPWVRRVAWFGLAGLFLQALLGGVTVLLKLPTMVSVSHAALAEAFFCVTITLALVTGAAWVSTPQLPAVGNTASLRRLALTTTVAIYLQILIGAVMRHMGAGLAIPDFPLVFGGVVPPSFSTAVAVHYAHRVGAFIVTGFAVFLAVRMLRQYGGESMFRRPALLLLAVLVIQFTLGAVIIWTQRAVMPATFHVAFGAALLGTSLVLTLRSYRFLPGELSK